MIQEIKKYPRLALCRVCRGIGKVQGEDEKYVTCEQCEGSGRVTVSSEIKMDIRPYKPRR